MTQSCQNESRMESFQHNVEFMQRVMRERGGGGLGSDPVLVAGECVQKLSLYRSMNECASELFYTLISHSDTEIHTKILLTDNYTLSFHISANDKMLPFW